MKKYSTLALIIIMILAAIAFPAAVFADAADTTPGDTSSETSPDPADPQSLNGWVTADSNTYYYADNAAVTGLQVIDNATYYFNADGVMQTGFQTIDGSRYYFSESGVMQTGFQVISGKKYYFSGSGVMQTGLRTINGSKYYFSKSGVMQTGLRTINGSKYYFSKNGVMQTGLKTINGAKYCFGSNGKALAGRFTTIRGTRYYFRKSGKAYTGAGWHRIGGRKYYSVGKSGALASRPRKINGKLYMFSKTGALITARGLFKYKGTEYYGLGSGVLHTGWKDFTENGNLKAAYFDSKSGAMAKGGKIGCLSIPKNGRLHEAYALGIQVLNDKGWTLKAAYTYSYRLHYYGRWWRTSSSEKYSLRGFRTHGGNCYVMASTFYIMGKLLGYDIHQVEGRVAGTHPHSWTVIRQDGREWVYDPNFRNETGRNGWKIWYGKHGTWKYSNYHKMN